MRSTICSALVLLVSLASTASSLTIRTPNTPLLHSSKAFESLPLGFVPGKRFIPPTFVRDPFQKTDSSHFLTNIDPNAVVGQIDKKDCKLLTTTTILQQTVVHPSTYVALTTTRVTSYLPNFKTELVVSQIRNVVTNTQVQTQYVTSYSTVTETTVSSTLAPAITVTSTSTTTQVRHVTSQVFSTLIHTEIKPTIAYSTVTTTERRQDVVTVPITSTEYITLAKQTRFYTQTTTHTQTIAKYIPGATLYDTKFVSATETVVGLQTLKPSIIEKTTTVVVPIYSTVYSTSVQLRTKQVWSTYAVTSTKSASVVTTVTQVGVAYHTKVHTTTVTTKHTQYSTVTKSIVHTVTRTEDSPAFTSRYTTHVVASTYTKTLDAPLVTVYQTVTSVRHYDVTVTNTHRTPIVHVTTTITGNCSK